MKILILDDDSIRHNIFDNKYRDHDVTHCYTYGEFVEALVSSSPWNLIHLDHDLGDMTAADTYTDSWGQEREYTGQHAANQICSLGDDRLPEKVIVHSLNPVGAKRIVDILRNRSVSVISQPFSYIAQ